ncbi:hypothetical protein [Rothia halotolerans]|uniref:hypothetical protein n=1 Tax=Rothia halotolerans TaxID=405770 RepID=UPI00101E0383|nr:hypothetical protein [Rothia halotolerans]
MLARRGSVVARGWAVGTVAVLGGASAHAVAEGHAPQLAVVLVCWALSGLLCTVIALCRLPALSGALGVLVSQGLLHWLFAQTGHGTTSSASPAAAAHAHHGAAVLPSSAIPEPHDLSPAMVLLHVAAAALTYLALRQGEGALGLLGDALALAMRGLFRLPARPVLVTARLRACGSHTVRALAAATVPRPVAPRGPPLPLLTS